MRYYLIAGEASGDLHASNLMQALRCKDKSAEFRFIGGDKMNEVGGTLFVHYSRLAYMGFIPVLTHLNTIFREMKRCKRDILSWKPDVVILVDYPGFNLSIAKFVRKHTNIPVYYYISPKIWAWKEYRIKAIRKNVDQLFSILPFEVEFYHGHHFTVHYIGNPTADEVFHYNRSHPADFSGFIVRNGLLAKPIIALLAGSRKQEIKDNLPLMLQAASFFKDYQVVVAGAPGLTPQDYAPYIKDKSVALVFEQTYSLLQSACVALVTSGTATLETALFGVPQIVCYYTPAGRLFSFLKKRFLKVTYVSLVNLIADEEVVPELVAHDLTIQRLKSELTGLLPVNSLRRIRMLDKYQLVSDRIGQAGAPERAADLMFSLLEKS